MECWTESISLHTKSFLFYGNIRENEIKSRLSNGSNRRKWTKKTKKKLSTGLIWEKCKSNKNRADIANRATSFTIYDLFHMNTYKTITNLHAIINLNVMFTDDFSIYRFFYNTLAQWL